MAAALVDWRAWHAASQKQGIPVGAATLVRAVASTRVRLADRTATVEQDQRRAFEAFYARVVAMGSHRAMHALTCALASRHRLRRGFRAIHAVQERRRALLTTARSVQSLIDTLSLRNALQQWASVIGSANRITAVLRGSRSRLTSVALRRWRAGAACAAHGAVVVLGHRVSAAEWSRWRASMTASNALAFWREWQQGQAVLHASVRSLQLVHARRRLVVYTNQWCVLLGARVDARQALERARAHVRRVAMGRWVLVCASSLRHGRLARVAGLHTVRAACMAWRHRVCVQPRWVAAARVTSLEHWAQQCTSTLVCRWRAYAVARQSRHAIGTAQLATAVQYRCSRELGMGLKAFALAADTARQHEEISRATACGRWARDVYRSWGVWSEAAHKRGILSWLEREAALLVAGLRLRTGVATWLRACDARHRALRAHTIASSATSANRRRSLHVAFASWLVWLQPKPFDLLRRVQRLQYKLALACWLALVGHCRLLASKRSTAQLFLAHKHMHAAITNWQRFVWSRDNPPATGVMVHNEAPKLCSTPLQIWVHRWRQHAANRRELLQAICKASRRRIPPPNAARRVTTQPAALGSGGCRTWNDSMCHHTTTCMCRPARLIRMSSLSAHPPFLRII